MEKPKNLFPVHNVTAETTEAPIISNEPAKAPTAKPTAKPTVKPTAEPTTIPTREPVADVYYKNCTAVRAAGADPIYVGDPGYAKHLDRDGDGVGCEK
ncbi:excalibur calcium-binding domain-containing protein [Paenibacillus sp. PL2-23]|uniref:excalibur calcium-binding domain-containing protein n=1 Tax=Paenibacillus sp. PL2-23 TaxID=2100729 RepID=UPI0030F9258B